MPVVDNGKLLQYEPGGLRHRTVAGTAMAVMTMEVWQQTIAPGAAMPLLWNAR